MVAVELVVLSRDASALRPEVARGIAGQHGVDLTVHRVVGSPRPSDANRWATIARSREHARKIGAAPWLMFLDDDVVLAPDCVARLVDGLRRMPRLAAVAADYRGEGGPDGRSRHVGMGATLFRAEALRQFQFRWEPGKCECQCCCDDLRASGWGIRYLPAARARHLKDEGRPSGLPRATSAAKPAGIEGIDCRGQGAHHWHMLDDHSTRSAAAPASAPSGPTRPPRVFAALNARHFDWFAARFLRTFRAAGNRERLTVLGYGLARWQRQLIQSDAYGADVVDLPATRLCPGVLRLDGFAEVLQGVPADTPVAYWDAGDVLFQSKLDGLWSQVHQHPGKLLVVHEPKSHPENWAVRAWCDRIQNLKKRRRVFDVLSRHLFLNSGFAAGSAAALLEYARFGADFLRFVGMDEYGPADQMALNYYCYTRPGIAVEVDEGWNYALAGRRHELFRWVGGFSGSPDSASWFPRLERLDGQPVHVVHGNAETLNRWLRLLQYRRLPQVIA